MRPYLSRVAAADVLMGVTPVQPGDVFSLVEFATSREARLLVDGDPLALLLTRTQLPEPLISFVLAHVSDVPHPSVIAPLLAQESYLPEHGRSVLARWHRSVLPRAARSRVLSYLVETGGSWEQAAAMVLSSTDVPAASVLDWVERVLALPPAQREVLDALLRGAEATGGGYLEHDARWLEAAVVSAQRM